MTDDAFLAEIEADVTPARAASMLAYADWLRDAGRDDEAYAWEWMARRGRFPRRPFARDWCWDCSAEENMPSRLPPLLFFALPLTPAHGGGETSREAIRQDFGYDHWPSLPEAVNALAATLKALREAVALPPGPTS